MSEQFFISNSEESEDFILEPLRNLQIAVAEVRGVINKLEAIEDEKGDNKYEDISGYHSLRVALGLRTRELWDSTVVFIEKYARIVGGKEFSTVQRYLSGISGMLEDDYKGEIEIRVVLGFIQALDDVILVIPSAIDDHREKITAQIAKLFAPIKPLDPSHDPLTGIEE